MKKITLLFLALMASAGMFAQPGSTCASAILVPVTNTYAPADHSSLSTDTVIYFKFVADSPRVDIEITPAVMPADTPATPIETMTLLANTCGNLQTLYGTNIHSDSNVTANARHKIIYFGLTPGATYYIRLRPLAPIGGGKFPTVSYFGLNVQNLARVIAPSAGLCKPAPCSGCSGDLICNGGFECHTACPTGYNGLNLAAPWFNPAQGITSPDYFHTCATAPSYSVPVNLLGNQGSLAGPSAYAGIVTYASDGLNPFGTADWREYLEQPLITPTIAGKVYWVSFNVSLADKSNYASNNLGVYFSNGATMQTNNVNIPVAPQIEYTAAPITNMTSWTPVRGCFTSTSGQDYITIGNFRNDVSTTITAFPVFPVAALLAYYYVDSVSVLRLAYAGSDKTICRGGATTLGPACPVPYAAYSWSPSTGLSSTTGASVTANPTVTTTYTLTVMAGPNNTGTSCVDTANVTVTVNAPQLSLTGSITTCQQPATYCVTAPGPGTFSWSVPSGITFTQSGNCITVTNWGSYVNTGATISVTFTDASGCFNTDSIFVQPCCKIPPLPNYVNAFSSAIPPANFVNTSFVINGIFTVDVNTTFNECKIFFGPKAKIVINDNVSLTILSNGVFSNCYSHLQAGCGTMWSGIQVNPLARLDVLAFNKPATLIEDADTAVLSLNGGVFSLKRAWFNKNFRDVVCTPFAGNHQGSIHDCVFTCRDLSGQLTPCPPTFSDQGSGTAAYLNTLTATILLPPHTGIRSVAGFDAVFVNTFSLGATGGQMGNLFDNHDYGISTQATTMNIVNNRFQNITGANVLLPIGCQVGTAICATGTTLPNFVKNITAGGPSSAYANSFDNCFNGIQVSTNMNADIKSNLFNNIQTIGIGLFNCGSRTLDIQLNGLTDAYVGMFLYNCPASGTTVSRNNTTLNPLSTNMDARGIWIIDITPATGGSTSVTQNTVSEVRFGIRIENKNAPQVINNAVALKNITSSSNFGSGITTMNCPGGAFVQSNSVSGFATAPCPLDANCTNAFCANATWWLSGVRIDLSDFADVNCNDVQNCGDGILAGGNMPTTLFTRNKFQGNLFRAFLGNYIFLNSLGSSTNGSDNFWNQSGTFAYNTYARNPLGMSTAFVNCFYVRNQAGYNPNPGFIPIGECTNDFFAFPPIIWAFKFFAAANPWPIPCPVFKIGTSPYLAQKIVRDSITFSANVASNRVMSKMAIFNAVPRDSALFSNTALVSFRDSARNGDIGALDSISDNMVIPMSPANANGLLSLNQGVSSTDSVSLLLKMVNKITLNNIAVGQSNYTPQQLHKLRQLARKCPYTHGPAVYQARAILKGIDPFITEYWNNCEVANPEEDEQDDADHDNDNHRFAAGIGSLSSIGKLYPNPASGDFYFEYKREKEISGKITIFNFLGEMVKSYNLPAGSGTVKISSENMQDGMYYVRIILSSGEEYSDKIIINR